MKRTIFLCLSWLLLSNNLQAAPVAKPVTTFDLFNFKLSTLELPLGERSQALGKALAETFPQFFSKDTVSMNAYSGVCFKQGDDLMRLAWYDSETEGFSFNLEKITGQKTCESPFSEGVVLKTYPLDPKSFFPISHNYPALELGVSTAAQIKAQLGAPDYSNGKKLIYVFKRDKLKEKGCGANSRGGDFYAIEVIFDLKNGKLSAIWLDNHISGEC